MVNVGDKTISKRKATAVSRMYLVKEVISHFQNEFCVTKLQPIGGGRKVPIVVGYRNLDEFVRRMRKFIEDDRH